jgi:Predicted pPIWI-associating nuclease
MNGPPTDDWASLETKLIALRGRLARCKAVNVNTKNVKNAAKEVVQHYFRLCRPGLLQTGIQNDDIVNFDAGFQNLLKLANGNNPLRRYKTEVSSILSEKTTVDAERERRIGENLARGRTPKTFLTDQEAIILKTLQDTVPSAGLSYRQVCIDLAADDRVSFRGTANELREALRELLNHLAKDEDVQKQTGFKLESGQTKPTMRQKVRFILRARGVSATAAEVPGNAVSLAEEIIGKLTRSAYNRSSLSTHVSTDRGEVRQMKMYVDGVLAELLEIHRSKKK